MAIKSIIWCDECGTELSGMEAAREHEDRNCMPWQDGDRVRFNYQLLTFPGTITGLGKLVGPGEERVVYIEADEQVDEPESQAHTGKDVFVGISALQKLEEDDPEQPYPLTHSTNRPPPRPCYQASVGAFSFPNTRYI